MNGQADRCDRTAYVAGLQPTISDIELFEVFNRVAHVEKVIVRNGAVRHALVVFKTVQGLYQVLINFQGTSLHGRQLHIRPLRESSHANSETIQTMFERAKAGPLRRASSANDAAPTWNRTGTSTSSPTTNNNYQRGYRYENQNQNQNNYGRRRNMGYSSRGYMSETAPLMNLFDPIQPFSGFHHGGGGDQNYHHNSHLHNPMVYDDYTEGAKRFDSLANLIRSSTPADPFANFHKDSRPRTPRDSHHQRHAPPTWKMELKIKQDSEEGTSSSEGGSSAPGGLMMTPQEFLAQIAQQSAMAEKAELEEQKKRKQRPNLSVINPSLFYEQYPRTSSPVVNFAPNSTPINKNGSPCDPAVVAYSRLLPAAPQSAFDGLSPIDTDNCSFITKHLGTNTVERGEEKRSEEKRDLTNDELSDMIVSTGNLRMNPPGCHVDSDQEGPAPWSPLKRLRAESGCGTTAQHVASPQFSPIKPKEEMIMMDSEEDEVFRSAASGDQKEADGGRKMSQIEDINNSRLPSNSHSAAPGSDQKTFVFPPEYPMCRHSSVPSIAHLVGDLSDFCPPSPHIVDKILQQESSSSSQNATENVDKTSEEAPPTPPRGIPNASEI
uniref:RRM domain-containing protein n=1 Tax=Caenorhabditis tropicalis TaxID=1561998 RepID=A0A1I7THM8_9PELO